ncbi:MAG: Ig-like domain-containing protein [Patescibacteria group bacterium]|nr:Ig-like domain-containing protein [Patescibacteria group bacterium]
MLFTSSDGLTKLTHDVVRYDPTEHYFQAYVKVPTVNNLTATDFYLYYNAAGVGSQASTTGVWSSYAAVYHFNELSGNYGDSTANNLDVNTQNIVASTTCPTWRCPDFDGTTNDYLLVNDSALLTGANWTVEAIARRDGTGVINSCGTGCTNMYPIVTKGNGQDETAATNIQFQLGAEANWYASCSYEDNGTNGITDNDATAVAVGAWNYFAGQIAGAASIEAFLNGASNGQTATAYNPNDDSGAPLCIAAACNTTPAVGAAWNGAVGEVRVSKSARSDAWIAASSRTIFGGGTYQTIGAEETYGVTSPTLTQSHYRWRLDDGNEAAGHWGANEDTATSSVGLSTVVRLRLEVSNEGTASSSQQYILQYGTGSDPKAGTWTTIPAAGGCGVLPFCIAASSLTEGADTTNVAAGLTDENSAFIAGLQKESNATTTHVSLDTTNFTEIEYAFQVTSNAVNNTAYYFRLATTTGNGVAGQLNTYTVTPQLTTIPAGDITAPTISNVSSDKANGSYTTGEVIDIDVTFSEAVTSTGNVTVTLETGTTDRTCTFQVSNATSGTCNYTVQAGDTTSDLTVSTIAGTIADQAANPMTNFAPATNLAANKALVIDTTSPSAATLTATTIDSSSIRLSWVSPGDDGVSTTGPTSGAYMSYSGSALTENFDSMGSAGTAAPTGWSAGYFNPSIQQGIAGGNNATIVASTLTVSNGSNDPSAVAFRANFGTTGASDRALGSFPRTTPAGDQFIQVAVKNDTLNPITSFTLQYTGEEWRNTTAPVQSLTMWYSNTSETSGFVSMGSNFTFSSPNNTGGNVAIDGNASGNYTVISNTYTPSSPIAAGSTFYLRWYDINDNALADDFFAIDDVTITPTVSDIGTAVSYDIRYSTSAINAGNWAAATAATGEPAPQVAGTAQTFDVTGLSGGTQYYFAMKTTDDVTNTSGLSNVPNATTDGSAPAPALTQSHYRWRLDDGNETAAHWGANEDTATSSVGLSTVVRLRMEVNNAGTASSSQQYILQYGTGSDPKVDTWTTVPASGACGSSPFCMNASSLTEGADTTNVASGLTDADAAFIAGLQKETNATTTHISLDTPNFTEIEYAFQVTGNAAEGTTYYFRFATTTGDGVSGQLNTYTVTPQLTTYSSAAAPTITSVSSDKANGSYTTGEVIDIDVSFSEAVTATTTVTVVLDSGGSCGFTVSNASTATCNYTVAAGQVSADLTASAVLGYLEDQAGNPMTSFLPAANLAANKALVIDASAPSTVSSLAVSTVATSSVQLTWNSPGDDSINQASQYVIFISVDGMGAEYVAPLLQDGLANEMVTFERFQTEGSGTLNARDDPDYAVTLPNHTTMATGRGVAGASGHGWTGNGDPGPTDTLATNKGSYVASVFDVAHDNGMRTGLWSGKSKFILFQQSYSTTTGAADVTGVDNGADKISYNYISNGVAASAMTTDFISQMTTHPFNYSFVHYQDPDATGHSSGWSTTVTSGFAATLKAVDTAIGRIFTMVENSSVLRNKTTIIITADHGGHSTTHGDTTNYLDYEIPFYVWGAGAAAAQDLYSLNTSTLAAPLQASNPAYATSRPVHNGDASNLALQLLGLSAIPGSTIDSKQDLATKVLGTPTAYDIRYSTAAITADTWAAATPVTGEPAPGAAGAAQTMTVSGLTPNTTYYFAMKAADEMPNSSALSNAISTSTSQVEVSCGGTLVQSKTASHAYSSPATSITVTLDAAATAGNLLIATVSSDKTAGAYTLPTGFTLVQSYISANVSGAMAYKVATGGETAVQWQYTNSEESNAWVGEYSGLATSGVLDIGIEADSGANAPTSLSSGTSAVTAQNDELAIAMMANDSWKDMDGGRSWSNGYAEISYANDGNSAGGSPSMSIATKTLSAAAAQETTYACTDTGDQAYIVLATFKAVACGASNPVLTQSHYRWRNDDGTEVAASWGANEDTATSSVGTSGHVVRLRMEVSNAGTASSSQQYILQYSNTSNPKAGNWFTVPASGSCTGFPFCMAASSLTEGAATTNVASGLTDSNSAFAAGLQKESNATTTHISLSTTNFTEIEYAFQVTSSAPNNTTLYFRLATTTGNGTAGQLNTYSVTPSLTTASSGGGGGGTAPVPSGGGFSDGQTGVPVDVWVEKFFDKSLASATVNTTNVTLKENTGNTRLGAPTGSNLCTSVMLSGNIRIECLHAALTPSKWYTFTITTGVTEQMGTPLATNYSFAFMTSSFNGGSGYIPSPVITSSAPVAGATIAPNATLRVNFSPGGDGSGTDTMATAGAGSVLSLSNVKIFAAQYGQPINQTNYLACASVGADPANPTDCNLAWNATTKELIITPGKKAPAGTVVSTGGTALAANTEYVLMVKGSASGTGVQNADSVGMSGSDYFITFKTVSADSTGPDITGSSPSNNATGIDRATYDISLGFNEAVDSASVTTATIKLYCEDNDGNLANGCTAGANGWDVNDSEITGTTVTYSSSERSATLSPNRLLAESTKYYLRVVSSSGVKDISGNAFDGTPGTAGNQDEIIAFTTAATVNGQANDTVKPKLLFANADNFSVVITFSEPVKFDATANATQVTSSNSTDANNTANWTLESPAGVTVSLTGKKIKYVPDNNSITISGLSFPPDQGFKITASTDITDLTGNAVDSTGTPAGNVAYGTVQSVGTTNGQVELGSGGSGGMCNYYTMGVQPVRVAPRTALAGSTSVYEVEFPATTVIPAGGQIVLTFPSGFSFIADGGTSECQDVLNVTDNTDINGASVGTVTMASVVCSDAARTVTVTTGGASTVAGDRLRFNIQGVKSSSVARDYTTSGYTVDVKTKNASGTLLDSKTSMPFYLTQGGSLSISGMVFNDNGTGGGTEGDGVKNGTEAGIANIQVCLGGMMGYSCTTTDSSGEYAFSLLANGYYSVNIPPLTSGSYVGGPYFRDVNLSGSNKTDLDFGFVASNRNITVTLSGIPSGTDLDVYTYGSGSSANTGFVVREVLWESGAQNGTGSATLPVSDGTWEVGVRPWMPKDPSAGMTKMPVMSFMPPQPKSVTVSGAGSYPVSFAIQTAAQAVKGKVVDGSGTAIANVYIGARPAQMTSSIGGGGTTQTGSDGTFSLNIAIGAYLLEAFMPGMPPTAGTEVTVVADTGNVATDGNSAADVYRRGVLIINDYDGDDDDLIVKISKGSYSIAGMVLDESGNAIPYAHVSGEQVDNSGNPNGPRMDASTDASGNFTLYVNNGTWKLRGFAPGYGELAALTVTISSASLTGQNLQATTATFGTVSGQVTQGGAGVAGVFVGIHGASGGNSTVTDASGNYELKNIEGTGYTIEGFLQGSGPTSVISNVTVTAGATLSGQDLTIGQTGTLAVTISGVTDAFVEAFDSSGRGNRTGANASGVYSITLPAGTYTVKAGSPSLGPIGSQTNVVIAASQTVAVTFTPPATYAVSGTVQSATAVCANQASVLISSASTGRMTVTTTDASGAFSVNLPNGTYSIGAGKPGCVDSAAAGSITVASAALRTGTNRTLVVTDATVSGAVTLSGSNVTVDTKVIAKSSDGRYVFTDVGTSATVGNNYTLNLTAGTWTVSARSDGYASSESSVTVVSGGSGTANLTLSAISGYTRTDQRSSTLKPSQGGIVKDTNIGDRFEVNFPAGTLGTSSDDGSILTKKTSAIVPQTESVKVVGSAGIEITPKDSSGQAITTLSSSSGSGVTVQVPYTDADVTAAGVTESQLVLSVWSEEKQQWEPLATTVDTTNNTLTAIVTHFSVFAPTGSLGGGTTPGGGSQTTGSTGSTNTTGGGGGVRLPTAPGVKGIWFNNQSALDGIHGTIRSPFTITTRTVTLTFSVPDASGMVLGNTADLAGRSWETYRPSVTWQLSDDLNYPTVYIRFRTSEGGQTPLYAIVFGYPRKLVKYENSPKVYLIENGLKRHIANEQAFLANGFTWDQILTIPASEKYPDGAPITVKLAAPVVRKLVKYDDSPKVYLIENGVKRHIANEQAFNDNGYRWNEIVVIPANETYPDGAAITAKVIATPAKAAYQFKRFLSIGSTGTDVRQLQAILRQLNYFNHPSNTGYYGTVTAEAVKKFQADRGIPVRGYVGPQTRDALNHLSP